MVYGTISFFVPGRSLSLSCVSITFSHPHLRSEEADTNSFKQESLFISSCSDDSFISPPLLVLVLPFPFSSLLLLLLLFAYHDFTNDAEIAGLTSLTHFQYASSRSLLCFSFKTMLWEMHVSVLVSVFAKIKGQPYE